MHKKLLSIGKIVNELHFTLFGFKMYCIFQLTKFHLHQVILIETCDYRNSFCWFNSFIQSWLLPFLLQLDVNLVSIQDLTPPKLWHHCIVHLSYQHTYYNLSHRNIVTCLSLLLWVEFTYKACLPSCIQKGRKLDPKSKSMILVGCNKVSKAYIYFKYIHKRIIIPINVVPNEQKVGIINQ